MKYFKNHHYVLFAHIVMSAALLAISFSMISIISISISILYLVFIKYIRKNRNVNYLIQLIIFSTIPFCYTTEVLTERYLNTDWGSIIPVLLILTAFFIAIRIPKSRKESILNVRSRYTEDDTELRRKANVFVSKALYVSLVPYFLLTLYFTWKQKIGITLIILFLLYIIIWSYTLHIGRKKIIKLKHSTNQ